MTKCNFEFWFDCGPVDRVNNHLQCVEDIAALVP